MKTPEYAFMSFTYLVDIVTVTKAPTLAPSMYPSLWVSIL